MLADRNKDLASHVATFLGSRSLVLDVNTSSTLLDKQLGELHDSGETTMTGISVCDDGTEIIDVLEVGTLGFWYRETLLTLFSVVEELSHEEVADLVGDGGLDG